MNKAIVVLSAVLVQLCLGGVYAWVFLAYVVAGVLAVTIAASLLRQPRQRPSPLPGLQSQQPKETTRVTH